MLVAYKHDWIDGGPIQLMVPCLFFFIPGDAISAGMLELADAFYVLTPGSHGLRGFETWLGGHPIEGFHGISDMVGLFTALSVGMLVAASFIRQSATASTAATR